MAKIDLLVIAVFFVSLILVANAAEEGASESYNKTNEISNLSYSNDTVTGNSYGLNNTETIADNKPVEANNSAENAIQNNLSNVNGTEVNNTGHLNDTSGTPENNSINLSGTLAVENENIDIEENQNKIDEIAADSNASTLGASSSAAESEEESATALTAGFGVYLEIVG